MRIGVLASGRGSNLQALLNARQAGQIAGEFVAVGSDQPGAFALERASQAGIPEKSFPLNSYGSRENQEENILRWLQERRVELLLLAGYMRVLSSGFISRASFPILNIHPSLLPSFPGLHAQRQALAYGVKISGCTVHFVDEGLDSGPIILQEAAPVLEGDTEETLSERILQLEHRLYPEAVGLLLNGKLEKNGRTVRIKP